MIMEKGKMLALLYVREGEIRHGGSVSAIRERRIAEMSGTYDGLYGKGNWCLLPEEEVPEILEDYTVTDNRLSLASAEERETRSCRREKAKAAELRAMRDILIAETDYLVLPDYPLPEAVRNEVYAYRRALRALPETEGFPFDAVWPEKPEVLCRAGE